MKTIHIVFSTVSYTYNVVLVDNGLQYTLARYRSLKEAEHFAYNYRP